MLLARVVLALQVTLPMIRQADGRCGDGEHIRGIEAANDPYAVDNPVTRIVNKNVRTARSMTWDVIRKSGGPKSR